MFGSRTNGESVGRAVKETRGFRDWIWGVAAVVLYLSVLFPVVDIAEGITKDRESDWHWSGEKEKAEEKEGRKGKKEREKEDTPPDQQLPLLP